MIKPLATLAFSSLILLQGCSIVPRQSQQDSQMGDLVLAEPAPANLRSQVALTRLTEILDKVKVPKKQKAEFLYQRGVLFDSLGLNGMALYDFNRAVHLNPKLAEAHNFMGIHYTQQMDFIQAYDEFDTTLQIDPNHEYAYLNRGIALYYGGRPELAVKDLHTYQQKDPSDPYRALWTYIAERDVNPKLAKQHLQQARSKLDNSKWATQMVDLYLGNISESQILSGLLDGVTNQKALTDKLCEAYFYLGKYHASMGQKGVAANYFKLALSTNVYEFVEHRYARLELDLMHERTAKKKLAVN